MWFHCFSYRVCEFSSHFFVCSRIYVRCILESFYSCRFMSVVSHFRYFQPYTRCNKFSGETLNINLLLCPFFSLHLALVCEHQTRMLAVPWMTCGTFWEKLTHTKNTEHCTFFYPCVHVVQANGLTYINEQQELVRGRTERWMWHALFDLTFRIQCKTMSRLTHTYTTFDACFSISSPG